jgi:predicted MFS family arabinose efflux permease
MLTCDAVRLGAFGALGALLLTGHGALVYIVIVAAVEAIFGAIFEIAEQSATPMLVPPEHMADAVARNSLRGSATGLIGPPISGLLFTVGRALPFLADALSYLLSFIGVALIRTPTQKAASERPTVSPLKGLGEGMRFVFTNSFLRPLLVIASSFNLALTGVMFALILALRLHGVSPTVIGVAEAILGVGGLTGALAAGFLRRRMPLIVLILGICWTAVALLAVDAVFAGTVLSVVPIALVVFLLPAVNSVLLSHLAAITPNEMQGRVISVLTTAAGGLAAVGPIVAGALVDTVGGAGATLFFAGAMTVAALATTFSRGIRQMGPTEKSTTEPGDAEPAVPAAEPPPAEAT